MSNTRLIIYNMLNGTMTRDQRKELQRWVKQHPKRNLNRIRKLCWEDVPIYKMLMVLHPNSTDHQRRKQVEKLTHFFLKLSEVYPSVKWRRRYRQDCVELKEREIMDIISTLK